MLYHPQENKSSVGLDGSFINLIPEANISMAKNKKEGKDKTKNKDKTNKGDSRKKGKEVKDLGDADIKDLDRIPQNIINENGGEDFTQEFKRETGQSKSDLYWNKDGNIYTVPKEVDHHNMLVKFLDRGGK